MPRSDSLRSQRTRPRIAQVAARLIAEHGLSDWSSAKRKACRELGLADDASLPANEEIREALREYNSLYRADDQAASLYAQREEALRWIDRLGAWNPVLVGGVAAGWATLHSDIAIELEADESKAVELTLVNADIAYTAVPGASAAQAPQLRLESPVAAVRLVILTPEQRRNRPRRDEDARLTRADLAAWLAATTRPADEASWRSRKPLS